MTRFTVVSTVAVAGLCSSAFATIQTETKQRNGTANETYFGTDAAGVSKVSASDLIDAHSITFSSLSVDGYQPTSGYGAAGVLNNGSVGTASSTPGYGSTATLEVTDPDSDPPIDGVYRLTYHLNLDAANGGSATGYDLTKVATYAANNDQRRNQRFELLISKIATPTVFQSLGTYQFRPDKPENDSVQGGASLMTLTDDQSGALMYQGIGATGVAAVQFNMLTPFSTPGSGNGSEETVYRELDVSGNATIVPEPAALGLVASAGMAFLVSRRRRRRSVI